MPSSTWMGLDVGLFNLYCGANVSSTKEKRGTHSERRRRLDETTAGEDVVGEPALSLTGFQSDGIICIRNGLLMTGFVRLEWTGEWREG